MWDRNRCLGIQSMQTYSYFKRYPLDKPLYKLLVRRSIHDYAPFEPDP